MSGEYTPELVKFPVGDEDISELDVEGKQEGEEEEEEEE